MRKQLLALALALLMALSMITPALAARGEQYGGKNPTVENFKVAKQTELESILLLRNETRAQGDKPLLPLNPGGDKVAVFGNGQLSPIRGSSGSGTSAGAFTYTLLEGLEDVGATYDETLADYYRQQGSKHGWDNSDTAKWGVSQYSGSGWSRPSPIAAPELMIDDGVVSDAGMIAAAAQEASTAIVFLQRNVGTEEMDRASNPPQPSDWYLNPSEYTLLKQVTDKFDDVVFILNTAGQIDMTWLTFDWLHENDDYNDGGTITETEAHARAEKIRAILWTYGSGSYQGLCLAELMFGEEDFSAKLADTITYDYYSHYSSDKFGGTQSYASNGVLNGFGGNGANYDTRWGENDPVSIYSEYVYTGYRYFDTFHGDIAGTDDDPVMYPFGYGMSYSDYAFSGLGISYDDATESFDITATITNVSTNSSLPAGKEVMEVYLSAPNDGRLDQPYQILVGYDKTKKLAAGESDTLTVNVPAYYMASYDEASSSYIMEEGDFYFRVGNSSRNTNIAGVVTVTEEIVVEKLQSQLGLNGAGSDDNQDEFDAVRLNSQTDGNPIVNPDDATDIVAATTLTLDQDDIETVEADYAITEYVPETTTDDRAYTLQAVVDGLLSMEAFVSQLTKDEVAALLTGRVGNRSNVGGNPYYVYTDDEDVPLVNVNSKSSAPGAGTSRNIQRLGIPSGSYADGGSGIGASAGFARPAGLACTWNPELQKEFGAAVGRDMLTRGVDMWLAPSVNLHRNPLNGRNTEYYSEDPMLSGLLAAQIADGVADQGVTVCLKHFAGNDQEQFRRGLYTTASVEAGNSLDAINTISSERALREVTLRAFEIPVKSRDNQSVRTVMSAFNKINGRECAASDELMINILRAEWGFQGHIVSDWGDYDDIAHAANEMRNGNDMIMSGIHTRYSIQDQLYYSIVDEYELDDEGNPIVGGRDTGLVSMTDMHRNAANFCYTLINSINIFDQDGKYNTALHNVRELEILSENLPIGLLGEEYSLFKTNPLIATGNEGTTYYKYSIAADSANQLPEGLELLGNGVIRGIPTATGSYTVKFQVEDDQGSTATKELSLVIFNASVGDKLANPRIGAAYEQKIPVEGDSNYSFALDTDAGDALPQGLTLDSSTGIISGTPTDESEIGKSFQIIVDITNTDDSTTFRATYVMTLQDYITVEIDLESPATYYQGQTINASIAATREEGDTFVITATGLPAGLEIVGSTLSGTLTADADTYNVTIRVALEGNDSIFVSIPLTIVVLETSGEMFFTSEELPDARVGQAYNTSIPVAGGTGTKTFELDGSSERPNGLTLNENTGLITWSPGASQYGYHKLVINVSDDETTISQTFWLLVRSVISVTPDTGAEFELAVDEEFTQALNVSGNTVDVLAFEVSDKMDGLPAGLQIDSSTGTISGTPEQAGTWQTIISVEEQGGGFNGAMVLYSFKVTGEGGGDPDPELEIESLKAVNGLLTVTMSGDADGLSLSDFRATVDGETLRLTDCITAGNQVLLSFNPIEREEDEATYTIVVTYEGSSATASLTVPAADDDSVDTSTLEALLDSISGLDEDDYTEESWNALMEAVEAAYALLDEDDVTQAAVDAAVQALRRAVGSLVEKDDGGDPDPGPGPSPTPNRSSSSRGSGNGGSSGWSAPSTPPAWLNNAVTTAVAEVTQATAVEATKTAVAAAQAGGGTTATVRLQNPGSIALETLRAMTTQAGETALVIHADSMNGNAVDVRLRIDPALATGNLNLAASTQSTRVANLKTLLGNWFGNSLSVVCLEQDGAFGQTVEVAVKLDAQLAASEDLVIYSYNNTSNTYSKLADQTYRVDANGYIRFHVISGGSYVISDGALAHK